jgi:NDP-4-keto-2,6-dideoxyhexose 3-C-methyltransferase
MFQLTKKCRLCATIEFESLYRFGSMALAGRFRRASEPEVPTAPLELIRCRHCGLVQLAQSVDPDELYRHTYGYRSGINRTMSQHLGQIAMGAEARAGLRTDDVVLDIASNDGTLLKGYETPGIVRIGIDPTIAQFSDFYPDDVLKAPDFFSASLFFRLSNGRRARVVTSVAMMYDLDEPRAFVAQIRDVLAPDGIWIFEQSDLVSMINSGSFDTICHEHLEYYSVAQLKLLLEGNKLRMFDVEKNTANGGSARIFACHADGPFRDDEAALAAAEQEEAEIRRDPQSVFKRFFAEAERMRANLMELLTRIHAQGRSIYLYGASTKGNVLLQFCGIDHRLIKAAADRNPQKRGALTPGTNIPIVSEEQARAERPDYFLVLPWHFRDEFIAREADFLASGGHFIFPRPTLQIYPEQTIRA